MNARLQLLFHADCHKFVLVRELDDWRKEFNRLREALQFAKKEGAIELPFLVLDEGEFFSESVVAVDPKNRNSSIREPQDLARFIAATLRKRDRCRVFHDALQRCWGLPEAQQAAALKAFAEGHRWKVTIHEPGAYGVVADFEPRALQ